MPAASKSRRVPRCVYEERGKRCVFGGLGTPPLCQAHRVIMADVARPQAPGVPKAGEGIGWLFNQFMSGQRVTKDDVQRVAQQELREFWAMGGVAGAGYRPNVDDPTSEQDDDEMDGFDGEGFHNPPPPQQPPPNAGPRDPGWRSRWSRSEPPPPPDPQARARAAARQVMGFTPTEVLTQDVLRRRFRTLAKKWHPDLHPPAKRDHATERMREVNASMDILTQELKR